jgi:uncharacterized protein (TIGR02444 family)
MTADDAAAFRTAALALYERAALREACLRLQDRDGLDVTVLLYCLWAAGAGRAPLDAARLARIEEHLQPWRETAIAPLRAVRRRLKGDARDPDEAVRRQVAAAEISAELIAMDLIAAAEAGAPRRPGAAAAAVALASLHAYAGFRGVAVAAAEDIRLLAAAAL